MYALEALSVKANVQEVLAALRANRETHKKIVAEARAGYRAKAIEMLNQKLDEVEKSSSMIALKFSIPLPVDQTRAYDTAIKMLELSTEKTVELNAQQVRHFVLDDWDWKQEFIISNKMYSATAAAFDE